MSLDNAYFQQDKKGEQDQTTLKPESSPFHSPELMFHMSPLSVSESASFLDMFTNTSTSQRARYAQSSSQSYDRNNKNLFIEIPELNLGQPQWMVNEQSDPSKSQRKRANSHRDTWEASRFRRRFRRLGSSDSSRVSIADRRQKGRTMLVYQKLGASH